MNSQVSSGWVGAGAAICLSLLVILVAGGRTSKEAPAAASLPLPTQTLQAPTPILDSVTQESKPVASSASTQVQVHPNATSSQHKESQ